MSRFVSLGHPLLLLLFSDHFCVLLNHKISSPCQSSATPSVHFHLCPVLISFSGSPKIKFLTTMCLKAIPSLHWWFTVPHPVSHPSPVGREMKCSSQNFPPDVFFPSPDCFWLSLCCIHLLHLWGWGTTKGGAQTQTKLILCL